MGTIMRHLRKGRLLTAAVGSLALAAGSVAAVASADTSSTPAAAQVQVPASCQNTSDASNGTPTRGGFPNDAKTGPEVAGYNEDNLAPSGKPHRWIITQDGATVNGVFHHGWIEVKADNVTIRNSVICGRKSADENSIHLIKNLGQNLQVINSIVRGERGDQTEPCKSAVWNRNYTVLRSEVAFCHDFFMAGGNVEVRDSWIHDHWTRFDLPPETRPHNDVVQTVSGVDELVFEGNASYGTACRATHHFQLAGGEGDVLDIRNNFFYGLHAVVNAGASFTGQVTGNTLAGSITGGPFWDVDGSGTAYGFWKGGGIPNLNISSNNFESGDPVPADGKPSPYVCVTPN